MAKIPGSGRTRGRKSSDEVMSGSKTANSHTQANTSKVLCQFYGVAFVSSFPSLSLLPTIEKTPAFGWLFDATGVLVLIEDTIKGYGNMLGPAKSRLYMAPYSLNMEKSTAICVT